MNQLHTQPTPLERSDQPITSLSPSRFIKPKIHHRVHNSPTLAPILSKINSVHSLSFYFLKIRFNIMLPYIVRLGFRNRLFPSRLSTSKLHTFVFSLTLTNTLGPSRLSADVTTAAQKCISPHPHVIFSLLGSKFLLSTPYHIF